MHPDMLSGTESRSNRQNLLLALLFIAALLASLAQAYFIDQPGVVDACYYYGGGVNLARGLGWNEFFLWNYLDPSASIPHPGNMYWMPLPSLLAAAGMFLAGVGFRQAQFPLIILATGFPFLVFLAGKQLTGSFRIALLAGFFSIASGFYVVYWLNTESFLTYAWLGGMIIFLSPRLTSGYRWTEALWIGILCGLAHMTRADGILFLALGGFLVLRERSLTGSGRAQRILALGTGYLLSSGVWYIRNLAVWGSLFPPGAEKAAWLVEYNDLFSYPSSIITMDRFFAGGLNPILDARWSALQSNLATTFFVLGLVFLFPFIGWGIWLLRRKPALRTALLYYLMIFFLMTMIYPFQGSRGGFLHSAAALLCTAAIAASTGLNDLIARLSRWRKWEAGSAHVVLGGGFAVLALMASAAIFFSRVIGSDPGSVHWSTLNGEYPRGITQLGTGLPESTRFMVNNTTCFHVQTGFQTIPITAGDPAMLLAAADRYDVQYVILDSHIPEGLLSLYLGQATNPRLKRVFSDEYGGMVYIWFEVLPPSAEEST
jgi:4-amino-4-deoxy-L-arabinose transferase-like glycosyltransferase